MHWRLFWGRCAVVPVVSLTVLTSTAVADAQVPPVFGARGAAECTAEGRCHTDEGASLSMLQFSASGRSSSGPFSPDGVSSPVPGKQTYRGVSMIYLLMPVSTVLASKTASNLLFGVMTDASHGGLDLDPNGHASVALGYYPDAEISWQREPGQSPTQNLPHHLLTVQLPLLKNGQKCRQTIYALVDDDRVMMILRMGSGVPAKLANFTFPQNEIGFGKTDAKVERRGVNLLKVVNITDQGAFALDEAERMFDVADWTWGTAVSNYVSRPAGVNMTFEKRSTKARLTKARKISVSLSIEYDEFDPFASIFDGREPVDAWWFEGDFDVTTLLTSIGQTEGAAFFPRIEPIMTALRVGGATLVHGGAELNGQNMSCSNADVVWVTMRVNEENLKKFLPPGLTLIPDEEGLLMLQRCQPGVFKLIGNLILPLEYNELWVVARVMYQDTPVLFPVLLLVDDDVALISGQDYAGTPKKLANLSFTLSPDAGFNSSVHIQINRHGRSILDLTGRIGQHSQAPVPGVNDNARENARYGFVMAHQFPRDTNIDRPMYVFPRAVQRTFSQHVMEDVKVEFGRSLQEPLHDWFAGTPTSAGYSRLGRDWGPNPSPLQFAQLPAEGWVSWWTRSFQMLYM